MKLFTTLRNYKIEYLPKDLFSGIMIAAVSIPIAMGYAQIAGLPAVYGLYGSVLPILLFALFSTSRQFILGVDATPAAIVGGAIAAHGFAAESHQAMLYIPMVALFAGLWLLVFYFLHADKIVDFISTPVMGGFISGIAVTIILMQIPKLMGSAAPSDFGQEPLSKIPDGDSDHGPRRAGYDVFPRGGAWSNSPVRRRAGPSAPLPSQDPGGGSDPCGRTGIDGSGCGNGGDASRREQLRREKRI